MGLTNEQVLARRNYIGGSDAIDIMSGNWHDLWLQKMGQPKRFDVNTQFRMDMGTALEDVIRKRWIKEYDGDFDQIKSLRKNHFMQDPNTNYLACNLDTLISAESCDFIQEIKFHTGMKDIEELADFYYPQLQHNMHVSCVDFCHFTVGFGSWGKYANIVVPKSGLWLEEYLALCKTFWFFVKNKKSPDPPEERIRNAPKPPAFTKVKNMEGSNVWANAAKNYLDNKAPAAEFENSKVTIKACIDEDVAIAYGYGIEAKKDKKGAVRISELTDRNLIKYSKMEKKDG